MRRGTMDLGPLLATTVLLALVACDDDPTSPSAPPPDVTRPDHPTHLRAVPWGNTVTLTWTAPGDDGSEGKVTRYEVRHGTTLAPYSATPVDSMDAVAEPGETESLTFSDLPYNTKYYFEVKALDEAGNASINNRRTGAETGLKLIRELEVPSDARELELDPWGNIYLLKREDDYDIPRVWKLLPDGSTDWKWHSASECEPYHPAATIAASPFSRDFTISLGWSCGIWRLNSEGVVVAVWKFPGTGLRADAMAVHGRGLHVAGAGNWYTVSSDSKSPYSRALVPWSAPNTYALAGRMRVQDFLTLLVRADCGQPCVYRYSEYTESWVGMCGVRSCDSSPEPGELSSPQGISKGPDGNIYVVDSNPAVGVQVFSEGGDFLTRWEVFGGRDIFVTEDGEVYVLADRPEDGARVVQVFGPE